ncbi:hypothetical protein [Aeromonas dhakensis]|uniref:hypothetical protein n=1 Tax=Aeromonas dhakensis TaxID=196024 RepID=UPI00111B8D64|nr:hypothetical protein [Aeromonas dhakensis]
MKPTDQQQEQRATEQRQQDKAQQQERRATEQRQQVQRQQQAKLQADRMWQQRISDQARQNKQAAMNNPRQSLADRQEVQREQQLAMQARSAEHAKKMAPENSKPSAMYEAYRENGLVRGAEHTRNLGQNGQEAIECRELEHQARQDRLMAMAKNDSVPSLQRERAELLRNAEEHSFRYEQLQRVIEADRGLGFDHQAENDGKGTFVTERMEQHREAADQAIEKLHKFDMDNQLVDEHGVPEAQRPLFSVSEDALNSLKNPKQGEQQQAMEALDDASQKLNQQGGGDSVSSSDKATEQAIQKEQQQKAQQKKEDDQAMTASMEARRQAHISAAKSMTPQRPEPAPQQTPQPHNEPEQGMSR